MGAERAKEHGIPESLTEMYRLSIALLLALMAAGCGGENRSEVLRGGAHAALAEAAVREAVQSRLHRPGMVVEALIWREELRIDLLDERLSRASADEQAAVASRVLEIATPTLRADPKFPRVRVLTVAIVHPGRALGEGRSTHVEDVFVFRVDEARRPAPGS